MRPRKMNTAKFDKVTALVEQSATAQAQRLLGQKPTAKELTIRQIADKLGVSVPLVYHYCPGGIRQRVKTKVEAATKKPSRKKAA